MTQNKVKVEINNKTILVTGGAGFIGAHLIIRLLKEMTGGTIVNIDNMNNFYDQKLKNYRLELIEQAAKESAVNYVFIKGGIADNNLLRNTFMNYKPSVVVNLAAQAVASYSPDLPDSYLESNIIGFYGILQSCRYSYGNGHPGVEHLVFASSAAVYGDNKKMPFNENDKADTPVSLYAATKRSNELLAYSYSKLYNMPTTGLRLFSVYGPAGRPDMFYYSATEKLANDETVELHENGKCQRDLTYIDDIVEGIFRVMQEAPERTNGDDGLPIAPYSLYNMGNGTSIDQQDFFSTLQEELVNADIVSSDFDFEAHKTIIGNQLGDVPVTCADIEAIKNDFGYEPKVTLQEGIKNFTQWYKEYSK